MKNSSEYSQKVQKLHRSLKRKHLNVQPVSYEDPVEALIYAVVSEHISLSAAQSAVKEIADYFIDLNDLRVSGIEEIVEVLGCDSAVTRSIASSITKVLMAIFRRYHTVSLESLKKTGKRPAKQALEKIEGVSSFMVDYCMLTALKSHAAPLTEKMIDYLRTEELVHPDADRQQIEGFLARLISAENAYEFYTLLRRESESRKASSRKQTKKDKKKKKTAVVKKKKTTKTTGKKTKTKKTKTKK